MKKSFAAFLIAVVLILSTLACGAGAPKAIPATPDIGFAHAAVNTSVAATAAAGQSVDATIAASVSGTSTASAAASAASASPTTASAAAATPVESEAVVQMTEEELAALIDQSVAAAVAAVEETSTATSEATADSSVDQNETQEIYVTVQTADEAIAYALELVTAYEDQYGELAEEALAAMQEIENDLNAMNQNMEALVKELDDINASLQQGLELATETITQLQNTAQAASAKAQEAQSEVQGYVQNLPAEMEGRVSTMLDVQPDNVPADLQSSVQAAFNYLDGTRQAMADHKVTSQELQEIARLGANASAGLKQFGGAKFTSLADAIGGAQGITAQLARGQYNQAMQGLSGLERSLGERPGNGRGGGRRP